MWWHQNLLSSQFTYYAPGVATRIAESIANNMSWRAAYTPYGPRLLFYPDVRFWGPFNNFVGYNSAMIDTLLVGYLDSGDERLLSSASAMAASLFEFRNEATGLPFYRTLFDGEEKAVGWEPQSGGGMGHPLDALIQRFIHLWKVTGDSVWVDRSRYLADAYLAAAWDLKRGVFYKVLEDGTRFPNITKGGWDLWQILIAYLNLYAITSEPKYLTVVERGLDEYLRTTHHRFSIPLLMSLYHVTGSGKYLRLARAEADFILRNYLLEGRYLVNPEWFGLNGSDVYVPTALGFLMIAFHQKPIQPFPWLNVIYPMEPTILYAARVRYREDMVRGDFVLELSSRESGQVKLLVEGTPFVLKPPQGSAVLTILSWSSASGFHNAAWRFQAFQDAVLIFEGLPPSTSYLLVVDGRTHDPLLSTEGGRLVVPLSAGLHNYVVTALGH